MFVRPDIEDICKNHQKSKISLKFKYSNYSLENNDSFFLNFTYFSLTNTGKLLCT